mgnify:CR=1 FL=1
MRVGVHVRKRLLLDFHERASMRGVAYRIAGRLWLVALSRHGYRLIYAPRHASTASIGHPAAPSSLRCHTRLVYRRTVQRCFSLRTKNGFADENRKAVPVKESKSVSARRVFETRFLSIHKKCCLKVLGSPVSYTHLTLPTKDSV